MGRAAADRLHHLEEHLGVVKGAGQQGRAAAHRRQGNVVPRVRRDGFLDLTGDRVAAC